VYSGDCFKAPEFPKDGKRVDKVLMNPPFGTDTPVHKFLDRGLEGLRDGGRLLAVVPDSVLFDKVRTCIFI
jgi:16S rRNA G1207 methylase RsmC